MFKTLVLPFLQSMSETAFLIYVIYLGLYSVKSHNSQKMLNLTYAWFLTIDAEAENEGEYRVGVEALQSGRKAGERTVSHSPRLRLVEDCRMLLMRLEV